MLDYDAIKTAPLEAIEVPAAELGYDCDMTIVEYYDGESVRPIELHPDIRGLGDGCEAQFSNVRYSAIHDVYIYDVVFRENHKFLNVISKRRI